MPDFPSFRFNTSTMTQVKDQQHPVLGNEKIATEQIESSGSIQKGEGSDVEKHVPGRTNFSEAEQKRIL